MTTIIARGHQQVHKYELALGGEPRQSAIKKVRSEMSRWLTDRSKKRAPLVTRLKQFSRSDESASSSNLKGETRTQRRKTPN
jgi:hypothetical protein